MAKYKFMKITEYDAVGGPSKHGVDEYGRFKDPTSPGRFVIFSIAKFVSAPNGTYPDTSGVPWGTPLRVQHGKMQINPNGVWQDLTSYGNFTKYCSLPANEKMLIGKFEEIYAFLKKGMTQYLTVVEQIQKLPNTWIFTDFGHITIKYFKDLNGDYILNGKEKMMSDFIHTTAQNEFATKHNAPVALGGSHGCIHVKPADIDTLISCGYAKHGNVVEVKNYITDIAPIAFESPVGRPSYEMHFYPKLKKIIVYWVTKM